MSRFRGQRLLVSRLLKVVATGVYGRRNPKPERVAARPDNRAVIDAFHRLFYDSHTFTWSETRWLGTPVLKNPLDLWVYQEIVYDTRPDVLVEAGTYLGGSALYFASLFDLLGHGRVVTIDVKDYANRVEHPRVEFLLGSSIDLEIVANVRRSITPSDTVMVVLDSDHRQEHVFEELRIYSCLVTRGNYLVVEDTNINGHPVMPRFGPGPMEAVEEMYLNYVAQHPIHMAPILKSMRNDPDYKALPALKQWPSWIRQQEMYIDQKLAIPVGVFYPATNIQIPFLAEVFDSGIIADEIVGSVQGRRKVKDAAQRINDRANDLIKKLGYPVPDPIRSEKKT